MKIFKILLQIKHFFYGHPVKDCKEDGICSIICKCGLIIDHSDYY